LIRECSWTVYNAAGTPTVDRLSSWEGAAAWRWTGKALCGQDTSGVKNYNAKNDRFNHPPLLQLQIKALGLERWSIPAVKCKALSVLPDLRCCCFKATPALICEELSSLDLLKNPKVVHQARFACLFVPCSQRKGR
jgi:hypothetical protein